MSQPAVAAFLRDPVTVSRKDLIEHYRAQTARYKELAERQNRSSIHDGLVNLARQCAAMADALGSPKADQSLKLTEAEVLILFDLRPCFHPGMSRVGWSFEPARLDAATGWGAKPPIARSGPSRCDAELLIVA